MKRVQTARRSSTPSHTRRQARSPLTTSDRNGSPNGRIGFFDQEQGGFGTKTVSSWTYGGPTSSGSPRGSRPLLRLAVLAAFVGAGLGTGA